MVTLKDEISSQKIFLVTWPNFIPKKITDLLLFATIYSNQKFLLLHFRFFISSYKNLANNYFLKINNRNTRKRREICSKLTKKHQNDVNWRRFVVFIVNSEHIVHLFQLFLLLTLNYNCLLRKLSRHLEIEIFFSLFPQKIFRYFEV